MAGVVDLMFCDLENMSGKKEDALKNNRSHKLCSTPGLFDKASSHL